MKILFKYPTRSRPDLFFDTLKKYYDNIKNNNFEFIINIDSDDILMNNSEVKDKLKQFKNLTLKIGNSKNKIEAVNEFIPARGWDIIVLVSDDMIPIVEGFDEIIRSKMNEYFPDTDGCLFFNDGHQYDNINTLTIMGNKLYNQFGYIYYPGYKTVACDCEFTELTKQMNKQKYFAQTIIEHKHPLWTRKPMDDLYIKNQINEREDELLLKHRRNIGFPKGIPKIAYFYWNNETPLSYLRLQTIITFRKLHPDWQMFLYMSNSNIKQKWTDIAKQEFSSYEGKDYLDEVKNYNCCIKQYDCKHNINPNYISDLFRYEKLFETGGWWFDLDQLFIRNLDKFCYDNEFVFGGKTIIYNGVIGSCIAHPIVKKVIDTQNELLKNDIQKYCQLGNWCLCNVIKNNCLLFVKHICQTPDKIFYPILESHNAKNLYNGVIDINTFVDSFTVHWFGGHPDSQEFNKKFTPSFAKESKDSISKFLRDFI